MIRPITATADETPQDVYRKLKEGQQQLWTVAEGQGFVGSAVTQIEQRDATRVLVVKYLAGEGFDRWSPDLSTDFIKFARMNGCDGVEAVGREGLRKQLLSLGWKKIAVVYRVPVNG